MKYETDHRFIDKIGREISFEAHADVIAHVDGKEIGVVQFDDVDGYPILFMMSVDPDYRRAGIATEMIRLAAQMYGKRFGRPSHAAIGGSGKGSQDYFTIEGAALFNKCIALGIVDDLPDEPEDSD